MEIFVNTQRSSSFSLLDYFQLNYFSNYETTRTRCRAYIYTYEYIMPQRHRIANFHTQTHTRTGPPRIVQANLPYKLSSYICRNRWVSQKSASLRAVWRSSTCCDNNWNIRESFESSVANETRQCFWCADLFIYPDSFRIIISKLLTCKIVVNFVDFSTVRY